MMSNRRRDFLLTALLVALPLAAYVPALRGGFVWDDADYVTENPTLRSLKGLWFIWSWIGATIQYYPLTFSTFWAEYQLWGLKPFGYHLDNVLLHSLGSILLWRLLLDLHVPGAWLAGAIFAVHPVHVESVAWITERKNTLSGVFFLSSAWAYLRFAGVCEGRQESGPEPEQSRPAPLLGRSRKRAYLAAVFLFACALLSKTAACPLPLALLVVIWWKRGRASPRDLPPLIPLFLMAVAMGLTTAWVEKNPVGADVVTWSLTWPQRLLLAPRSLCFYLGKIIWPLGVCFVYPRWTLDPGAAWQYVFPLGVLGSIAALWSLRGRFGRGPLAAMLYFIVMLAPTLGFIKFYYMTYSFVADHFQYLASMGPIALLAAILSLATGFRTSAMGKAATSALSRPATAIRVALIAMLGFLTWRQAGAYRDLETLWKRTLDRNPNAWMALNNLGHLMLTEDRVEEAEPYFRRAIVNNPEHGNARFNLASILANRGQANEAIDLIRTGLRTDPDSYSARNNLGHLLIQKGEMAEAEEHLREAVRLKPDFADAQCNLGIALTALGRAKTALPHLQEAVRLDPKSDGAFYACATALIDLGRPEEALPYLNKALDLKPDYSEALHDSAVLLSGRGRRDEAVIRFRKAIRLTPDFADAHFNLASTLEEMGRREEAALEYREVLRINPADEEARRALQSTGGSKP